VAAMGICEQQYVYGFSAGPAGTGAGVRSLFTCRNRRNVAKDTIIKLMTAFKSFLFAGETADFRDSAQAGSPPHPDGALVENRLLFSLDTCHPVC
jgi:hypothetical protein